MKTFFDWLDQVMLTVLSIGAWLVVSFLINAVLWYGFGLGKASLDVLFMMVTVAGLVVVLAIAGISVYENWEDPT